MNNQDNAPSEGIKGFLQKHSLRLAGALNLVGDVGLLAKGLGVGNQGKKDIPTAVGGALYTLGGLNLLLFSGVDDNLAMQNVTQRLADYMEKEAGGLNASSQLAQAVRANQQDISWMQQQAAQNTLGLYTLGAGALLYAGVQKFNHIKETTGENDYSKLYYGTSSLGFKLASYMLPEKPKDAPGSSLQKAGFFQSLIDNPLKLFGYGSMLNEVLLANDAISEYRGDRKEAKAAEARGESYISNNNYKLTAASTISYMLSDALMVISSKDPSNAANPLTQEQRQQLDVLVDDALRDRVGIDRIEMKEQITAFLDQQPEIQQVNASEPRRQLSAVQMNEKMQADYGVQVALS